MEIYVNQIRNDFKSNKRMTLFLVEWYKNTNCVRETIEDEVFSNLEDFSWGKGIKTVFKANYIKKKKYSIEFYGRTHINHYIDIWLRLNEFLKL